MSKKSIWAVIAALAALAVPGLAAAVAYDQGTWNVPYGVTETAQTVYDLHMLIFWVCVVIAIVVFGAMFYSVFAHRKSKHPKPADFHESTTVEIAWTIVPFLILVAMAIPAAATLIKMDDTSNSELTLKITGYQWKWHYEYVDKGVSFFSTLHADSNQARQLDSGIDPNSIPNYLLEVDNHVVLPTGRKIRFLTTANDVIHAWWIPDFGVKKDAIPGFINEMWTKIDQPGFYRGVCAELCGRDHGFMPIVVHAVEPAQFDQWLADKKAGKQTVIGHGPPTQLAAATPAAASDAAPATPAGVASPAEVAATPAAVTDAPTDQGAKLYNGSCAACHQPDGKGLPPNFPALAGSAIVNGPAAAHIEITLKGKGLMPPFPHLSDAELAAVLTHERTSWGNTGGAVTADQVKAQRGK